MMIPTQPEDQPTLDPLMWAVWQLDPTEENIDIVRIVADKDTAERIVQTQTLLRRQQAGCYQASASSLFDLVLEQGRLKGQTIMLKVMDAIREEVQALREELHGQRPVEVTLKVPDYTAAPGEGPLPPFVPFVSKAPAEVKTNLDCAQPSPEGFLDVPGRNRLLDQAYPDLNVKASTAPDQAPSKTAVKPWWEVTHNGR